MHQERALRPHSRRTASLRPRLRPQGCCGLEPLERRTLMTTIAVTTFGDVVNPVDGLTSLREALSLAASKNGATHIKLPAGTYPLSLGQLTIDDPSGEVRIEAAGKGATIDAQNNSRAILVQGSTVAVLDKLTITGGLAGGGGLTDVGGGIDNDAGATLTLQNCTVRNNAASINGGGIFNGDGAKLTLKDSTVSGNVAGSDGGGIANFGGVVTLQKSTVGNNTAFFGGGIVNSTGGVAVAGLAGVSGARAAPAAGTIILKDSAVRDNISLNGDGAGIFNGSDATLTLTKCDVTGNTGAMFGGGIDNFGTLALTDCTVSGNAASADGGGIRNGAGTLTLKKTTIRNNTAASGGGIWNAGTLILSGGGNSITGNTPDDLFQV